jgi:glucosamine-6-phosphate deaminase
MNIIIQPNAILAAETVANVIAEALLAQPDLVLGLATGRTMESVYDELVRKHRDEGLDFWRCHTFNLDEYVGLKAGEPCSYHYFMRQRLFDRVNIQLRNTHLPDGMAGNLPAECIYYENLIREHGGIMLQLLGIGINGHLGFNEPSSAFRSRTRVQALSRVTRTQNAPLFSTPNQMPHLAITMGIGTILDARRCLLLATGFDKAEIVARALEGPLTAMVAASALQLHPNCTVVLDEAAASQLQEREQYSEPLLHQTGAV